MYRVGSERLAGFGVRVGLDRYGLLSLSRLSFLICEMVISMLLLSPRQVDICINLYTYIYIFIYVRQVKVR